MTINTEEHVDLLSQIPTECFRYTNKRILFTLKKSTKTHDFSNIRYYYIKSCYDGLASSLRPDNYVLPKTPDVRKICNEYHFLDYIDPQRNHIKDYLCEGKGMFLLPRMYKNALVNSKPSRTATFVSPKPGFTFQEVNDLKNQFIKTMSYPFSPCRLDDCYYSLKNLADKANFSSNKRFGTLQGSIILRRELIDLLYNLHIIRGSYREMQYAPNKRYDIMEDIEQHKKAMFGELQR